VQGCSLASHPTNSILSLTGVVAVDHDHHSTNPIDYTAGQSRAQGKIVNCRLLQSNRRYCPRILRSKPTDSTMRTAACSKAVVEGPPEARIAWRAARNGAQPLRQGRYSPAHHGHPRLSLTVERVESSSHRAASSERLLLFRFTELRRLGEGEKHDLFAGGSANVMVQA
jgi:hypothetical protein